MTSTAPLSWAWPRFANVVAVVAVVGLVVAVVTATTGHEPAGDRPVPRRRRGDHADGRPAPRRRRQPVPALLLPRPRRRSPPSPPSAFDRLVPRVLPACVVAAMAWWAIKPDADRRRSGVHPATPRQRRRTAAGAARPSRRRRLADGRRRADRRRRGRRRRRLLRRPRAVEAPNRAVESGIRWPRSCAPDRSSFSD